MNLYQSVDPIKKSPGELGEIMEHARKQLQRIKSQDL